jgi:hypothetical protein
VLAVNMNTDKLGKLIKMLSSPNEGEVVAAARAILRTLEAEGGDIHELAARVADNKLLKADMQRIYDAAYRAGAESTQAATGFADVGVPSFHSMACEVQHKGEGRLTPKEQDFIDDMVRWCARREPSEKQAKWIHALYCRFGRRT